MAEPPRKHRIRNYLIGLVATVVALALIVVGLIAFKVFEADEQVKREQAKLAPFYVPPKGWEDATAGTVFRKQRVANVPSGSVGWRILYRSDRSDGAPSVSGGLVFAPDGAAPPDGRPVVAWAHGTVGMGEACAPSRTPDVTADVPGLGFFLQAGWVVVATDYSGLGTAGIEEYLVGEAEARDVLNSIRAAQTMPDVGAGSRVALWGHSQGGHTALWTAALAPELAPELEIVATAAAAPAAELVILFQKQWDQVIGSLIGSEVLVSWPKTYPDVEVNSVVNPDIDFRRIAEKCIVEGLVDLEIRSQFGQQQFRSNPMKIAPWERAAEVNTPPLPSGVPTLIAQGLADPVVLPPTTATYTDRACAADSNLTSVWMGDVGHMKAGFTAAPIVFTWFQQRFAGIPATPTCGTELPVQPFPR